MALFSYTFFINVNCRPEETFIFIIIIRGYYAHQSWRNKIVAPSSGLRSHLNQEVFLLAAQQLNLMCEDPDLYMLCSAM